MTGWSRVVVDLDGARQALAEPTAPDGPLDLRARAALSSAWQQLGFAPLADRPGAVELVRPLLVPLPAVEDTRALGARLAEALRPGDLVVLVGPLGAGKTALTQGIGAGLGVTGAVTSPTYVLARRHAGPVPLLHVDAYRLAGQGPVELDDLDLDQALEEAVTVVEWGAGLVESLAPDRLEVRLDRDDRSELRTARVRAHGARWSVLSELTPRVRESEPRHSGGG